MRRHRMTCLVIEDIVNLRYPHLANAQHGHRTLDCVTIDRDCSYRFSTAAVSTTPTSKMSVRPPVCAFEDYRDVCDSIHR